MPAEVLWPRKTRADRAAYDAPAHTATPVFAENCTTYADRLGASVNTAGPIGA
jgi:ATP-dependent phosphoenolpyruvate carboxykinase